jgi:hypothetical protein
MMSLLPKIASRLSHFEQLVFSREHISSKSYFISVFPFFSPHPADFAAG